MSAEGGGVLIDVQVIVAGALDRERRVRRVQLDGGPWGELTDVERGVPGGHPKLDEVGLLVVEPDLRAIGGAHEDGRSDLDLHARALPRVEGVTRRQGSVELGRSPVLRARAPEGHFARQVAHPGRCGLSGQAYALCLRGAGRRRRGRRCGSRPQEPRTARPEADHHEKRHDPSRTHVRLRSASATLPATVYE